MKRALAIAVRWIYLLAIIFCGVYFTMHFVQHSAWYKQRLYRQLLTGDAGEKLRAASALAHFRGEHQLLEGLKSETPAVRDLARRALEHLWFNAAGHEAYELTQASYQAAEREEFQEALALATRLVEQYPGFAEGWNRRASIYWQMNQWEKSIADSERTLVLNPHHYGAWQGIGVCRLQLGEVAEACRCLRAALKIMPHDESTQRSLRRCEELLRTYSPPSRSARPADLI